MGLDLVELVMRVEDEFGIAIADVEAQEAATVGKLYELVFAKIPQENANVCLTSASFYRTRKALMSVLGLSKQQIRPSTPLEALIPEQNRAALWASIQAVHPLTMPKWESFPLSRRKRFPKNIRTVGELAEQVLSLNHKELAAEYKGWNADDVWKTLCWVIVDQTGVKIEEIKPEARFVQDLRLD